MSGAPKQLSTQHHVDASENCLKLTSRYSADALTQLSFVERYD
jgi:hypothetical protein